MSVFVGGRIASVRTSAGDVISTKEFKDKMCTLFPPASESLSALSIECIAAQFVIRLPFLERIARAIVEHQVLLY